MCLFLFVFKRNLILWKHSTLDITEKSVTSRLGLIVHKFSLPEEAISSAVKVLHIYMFLLCVLCYLYLIEKTQNLRGGGDSFLQCSPYFTGVGK